MVTNRPKIKKGNIGIDFHHLEVNDERYGNGI